jgi:hypothetical protein
MAVLAHFGNHYTGLAAFAAAKSFTIRLAFSKLLSPPDSDEYIPETDLITALYLPATFSQA